MGARSLLGGALVVILAVGIVACGGGGGEDAASRSGGPRGLLEDATLEGVSSGEMGVGLMVSRPVAEESASLSVTGTFRFNSERFLEVDGAANLSAHVDGQQISSFSGLTRAPERLVFYYDEETYEPDPAELDAMNSEYDEAQERDEAANPLACVEAAEGIERSSLVSDLELKRKSKLIDGTPVDRIAGTLDVPAALGALAQMTEDPGCGSQLDAAGFPIGPVNSDNGLIKSIQNAKIYVALDKNHVLRQLILRLTAAGDPPAAETSEIEFKLSLSRVNEIDKLPVPSPASPLDTLFRKLAVDSVPELQGLALETLGKILTSAAGAAP